MRNDKLLRSIVTNATQRFAGQLYRSPARLQLKIEHVDPVASLAVLIRPLRLPKSFRLYQRLYV